MQISPSSKINRVSPVGKVKKTDSIHNYTKAMEDEADFSKHFAQLNAMIESLSSEIKTERKDKVEEWKSQYRQGFSPKSEDIALGVGAYFLKAE